jgi:class 3 adenylate cyclase/DNA-binding winged helix-turn-helix (wHTH) protein/tetratricopeptide (TPR) repeat protein
MTGREMEAQIKGEIVAFGDFRFDVALRRLLRRDTAEVWAPVAVGSRALDVLAALLRQPGALVTKDALMRQVWPGIAVEAANLNVQIAALRKALDGNRGSESCIQTVSGRGYRFVAPVTRFTAEGGSELPPQSTKDPNLPIGSATPSRLRNLGASMEHEHLQAGFISTDLSPNAGTLVAPGPAEPGEKPMGQRPAERRQLTVMVCDVVGLAALSTGFDLEDLGEMVTAWHRCCADIVEQNHGYVASYSTDGVLAYFGYPQADEHDGERAVRTGLALVEAAPKLATVAEVPLHVGVGIATGMAVTGDPIWSGALRTFTAVGSTPSLAARLQGLAAAGQTVIAASTRRLIGNAFELTDLGEHHLKGIAEPVHAWRVERALATESRFDAQYGGSALTPLVGREEELGLLLRRWSQTRDSEGQVVLLSGEPGIGKSRILSALRERLEAQSVQSLRFQCSPYYVNSAYWPMIDNVERALKFTRDETTDSKLDKLEALIVTRYGRPLTDVRFVAAILSLPCEKRYGVLPMTLQKYKDETLRTLVDITEAAARQQPSVLLFEDAHWADPTTLEVLDLLIDRVKTVPLLVVLTHRPEFQSRWSGQGHVGALNLSKLTRAQSAAMVSALAGGKALPAPLLEQILTRTDGVPLFVEELTKSILESGELKQDGDLYEYGGSARAVTIPATLRDSLTARLDRFTPVKEIAQIGAAIGREFSYELIAAVAPMPLAQLDDALTKLSESGLAFRRGTPPDAIYSFKHALVLDAAYDSLLKSRRQELHGKIARAIEARFPNIKTTEPEVLARHLTEAGLAEAAIPLWQAAGDLASKRMALAEAISHLNRGLGLVATLPWSSQRDASELGLRIRLGPSWHALKGAPTPEVWTSLHPALAIAKSLERNDALAPVLWGLALNVMTQGRVAECLPWAEEMLDLAKATADPDLLISGHGLACAGHFWMGEFTKAVEHADKVLDLYDAEKHRHLADILNQDPKTRASIISSISSWILGYPDRALRLGEETDAHARRRGHPVDVGFALITGVHEFDRRCELEDLLKRAEECERLGRENSLPQLWAMMAPISYGQALIEKGKPAEGIARLKAGIAFFEATGGKSRTPTWKACLAEGMALTSDLDNALHLIDEQIDQVERPGWEERYYYAEILRLKGWMLSLKGDLEGAERGFFASLDWARRQQAKSWELRTSTSLARLWQSQGKRQDAYELLAPVYGWFTEGFDTKDLHDAKSLLAELS